MALPLVQDGVATGTNASTASLVLTVAKATTAGNTLLLAAATRTTGAGISSVTDSRGNTWAVAASGGGGTFSASIAYATHHATALQIGDTITVNFGGAANIAAASVSEWAAGIGAIDKTAAGNGTSNSALSNATATTSQANELLFACVTTNGAPSGVSGAGVSYTLLGGNGDSAHQCVPEYRVVAATGTYTASATLSGSSPAWGIQIATFRYSVAVSATASDTLSAVSDSAPVQLLNHPRTASDTLSSVADSAPSRLAVDIRAIADTISAVAETLTHAIARFVPIGLSTSGFGDGPLGDMGFGDSSAPASEPLSAVTDTPPSMLAGRTAADAISAVADSAPTEAATHFATAADTLSAFSDASPVELASHTRPVADALSSTSDSPPIRLLFAPRIIADTIASVTDSTAKTSVRFTTDGLSAVSDAGPSQSATHPRAVGDIAASISDLPLVGARSKAVFDTATAISDTIRAATSRSITDIAASVSDSTPTSQRGLTILIADQLAVISDDLYAIYPAFARLRLTDRATTQVDLRTLA